MNEHAMWQAKVLAYLHDPAVKALVLMRGESHVAVAEAVIRELFGDRLTRTYRRALGMNAAVEKADHWAAAADRPSLPRNLGGQVVFAADPQVIHPLTGEQFRLSELASDAHREAVKAVNLAHFERFVVDDDDGCVDWRKTFLKLWRFGPETPAKDLGVLWNLLPADTRSPDHSIWEHLKLTSAFAGALAAGEGGPALLLMSFGPVQGFIAQARSVSDLWAGSHLLSRIAWEGMRIVCEGFGPDAVLFPDLHGVAVADLWLKEQLREWPDDVRQPWAEKEDDTNPLFAAALPNRFVTLVPAGEARTLAREVETAVSGWVRTEARKALAELLASADKRHAATALREALREDAPDPRAELTRMGLGGAVVALEQIERQLAHFPEVHWAVVPWHLAGDQTLDDHRLKGLLTRLGADSGYLDPSLDGLLRGEITVEGHPFFRPNPGTAYPGLFEALERLHAAAKAARPFDGEAEHGYRCTLCGEREWLTDDKTLLAKPSGERKERSLWTAVAKNTPALAKEGEHLCGLCTLKRGWPRLFVQETGQAVPELDKLDRFALSTRSVAMSTSIWRWAEGEERGRTEAPEQAAQRLQAESRLRLKMVEKKELKGAALPRRLFGRLRRENRDTGFFKRLPALLDAAKDDDEARQIAGDIDILLGGKAETYYALVLMDGDRMGAWLAGDEGRQKMEKRFHATTLAALARSGDFGAYLGASRPASPSRHQAISTALNSFALHLARVVVEDLFMGKLIYAGGDDLMAMVAVHDLPGLMLALRCCYSGVLPDGVEPDVFWQRVTGKEEGRLRIRNGFALMDERMFRLMGDHATASMGAVVVHHQAPLGRVLAHLRAAERRAKGEGGRDAYCLTLAKRAGGTTHLLGNWRLDAGMDGDMGLLLDLRDLIAWQVSRRAAYLLAESLRDLPAEQVALSSALAYRFGRQSKEEIPDPAMLAARLASTAVGRSAGREEAEWPGPNLWLRDMLLTAEFLAREGRVGSAQRD